MTKNECLYHTFLGLAITRYLSKRVKTGILGITVIKWNSLLFFIFYKIWKGCSQDQEQKALCITDTDVNSGKKSLNGKGKNGPFFLFGRLGKAILITLRIKLD